MSRGRGSCGRVQRGVGRGWGAQRRARCLLGFRFEAARRRACPRLAVGQAPGRTRRGAENPHPRLLAALPEALVGAAVAPGEHADAVLLPLQPFAVIPLPCGCRQLQLELQHEFQAAGLKA